MRDVAELLDRLDAAGASRERVTVDEVQDALGRDAFAPALLTLGLLALSPVGDMPGAPTILALFIVSVGAQMAAGRSEIWLPRRLAGRSLDSRGILRASRLLRPVVRVLGRVIWARLTFLTEGWFARMIAAACVLLALTLPPLEVVPFGATVPSSAITGFAAALVARDGLLALVSLLLTGCGIYLGARLVP